MLSARYAGRAARPDCAPPARHRLASPTRASPPAATQFRPHPRHPAKWPEQWPGTPPSQRIVRRVGSSRPHLSLRPGRVLFNEIENRGVQIVVDASALGKVGLLGSVTIANCIR